MVFKASGGGIFPRKLQIQKKLNNRPREKLNFETPKKRFFENLN
jgi:IS30 family transposase